MWTTLRVVLDAGAGAAGAVVAAATPLYALTVPLLVVLLYVTVIRVLIRVLVEVGLYTTRWCIVAMGACVPCMSVSPQDSVLCQADVVCLW